MQVICYEDSFVNRLSPIVHARPAYAISCASHQLIDWLQRLAEGRGKLTSFVRDYLIELQKLDFGLVSPTALDDSEGILLVNSRLVPSVDLAKILDQYARRTDSSVVLDSDPDVVLLARIQAADLDGPEGAKPTKPDLESLLSTARQLANSLALNENPSNQTSLEVFNWPHEVVSYHMKEMSSAMQWRIEQGHYQQLLDGVFVREGVKIGDYASIHTSEGPIILDEDVKIGPFSFLEGPLYAGSGTRVLEHSAIKDGVSLGHTVKVGGEVEASIIEPFTNKQHHGFLGHSYLGSWINLGAGTCNSDLKNTYGKINIQYGDQKVPSGMQFLGCIMGDYSKTAINTGIFTGKVIGVCSNLYGFVTSNVPSYMNYARMFGQAEPLPVDVMIKSQHRMFARRNREQRECDRQLIIDMYHRTESERQ